MAPADHALLVRILVGFALGYVCGFERRLRGSVAGDRTFALVGGGAAAITAVVAKTSPQAIAGIVTGVGFIGGGLLFRGEMGAIRGITTAATIFTTAAIGIVVGYGHLLLGVIATGLFLLTLELQNIPVLRCLDADKYVGRFKNDHVEQSNADEGRPSIG